MNKNDVLNLIDNGTLEDIKGCYLNNKKLFKEIWIEYKKSKKVPFSLKNELHSLITDPLFIADVLLLIIIGLQII
jgi:hypothetical protein